MDLARLASLGEFVGGVVARILRDDTVQANPPMRMVGP